MKPDIDKMLKVWNRLEVERRSPTPLPNVKFDEILSSIFTMGPSYYYLIDFSDMSISNISPGFAAAHGVDPEQIKNIHDVLSLIHPDDMEFVAQAEEKSVQFIYQLGIEWITRYKSSYNLRFKAADGKYRLFNHQSLVLAVDEHNNFVRSINIHTDISHLTHLNNHKWSVIGLAGEPSYLNMDVLDGGRPASLARPFSKRELEVVELIAKGYSTNQIAEKLFISPDTVKVHRKHIMKKSGCSNVAELSARSLSEGWV